MHQICVINVYSSCQRPVTLNVNDTSVRLYQGSGKHHTLMNDLEGMPYDPMDADGMVPDGDDHMEMDQMAGIPEEMAQPLYNIQPPIQIPVTTPGTMPHAFQPQQLFPKQFEPMLGQGTKGPDVLFRIQMGLQSGVRSETDWCLSTLLTFTAARNFDVLRGRTDIILNVIKYIYANWDAVTASKTDMDDSYDILVLRQKVLEALLIVRNMCLDIGTAQILAPETLGFVEKGVCDVPDISESRSLYLELRLLVLEICEHVCFLYPQTHTASESRLFRGLVNILAVEHDKSMLIASMRSITRLMVADTREASAPLGLMQVIEKVSRYLYIDDPELNASALDFLAQFTARLQRIEQLQLPQNLSLEAYATQLVRLLTFRMDREPQDFVRLPRRTRKPAPLVPPEIPPAIMADLLTLDEPERATMWIRSCYETDPDGEVLQVSLWTNYQRLFEQHERDGTGKRMLKAIDFIRTCTTNVKGAQAKVITTPEGPKKFIIKGLVPREKAVPLQDLSGIQGPVELGPEEETPPRGPPVYGNTAALVLTNIAKLQGGKEFLQPYIPEIMNAIILNPQITINVDRLLTELK